MSRYYGDEQHQGSKSQWLNDVHAARREAIEIRQQIPAEYARTRCWGVPQSVRLFNEAVQTVAELVRPKMTKSDGEPHDLWAEPVVDDLYVPQSSTVEVPFTQVSADGSINVSDAIQQLPTNRESLSPHAFATSWRSRVLRFEVAYLHPHRGHVTESRSRVLHVPVYALDRIMNQINLAIDDLGWLPDAAEKDVHSDVLHPEGVPDDLVDT